MGKGKDKSKSSKALKPPKTKCCVSSSKCGRCPLRMLKEGTLPAGYAVKRRRLVTVAADGSYAPVAKKAKIVMTPTTSAGKPEKSKKKDGKRKLAAAA